MKEQHIRAAVRSDKGCKRGNNEDNFYLNGAYMPLAEMDQGASLSCEIYGRFQIFAVCDGMGGEAAGELASSAAVGKLKELQNAMEKGTAIQAAIDAIVQEANEAVCVLGKGAGSTLALLCLHEGYATCAWLGDSRIYLYRGGTLYRLTEDHTQSQRLVNLGVLDAEAAKGHETQNVLTRYLGMEMEGFSLRPAYGKRLLLQKDDVFLLCSDGLTGLLEEETILAFLEKGPLQAAEGLIEEAIARGGRDNITALIAQVLSCKRKWFAS